MSRTRKKPDKRHNQLIIKHRDGSETAVTPMKPWTPPAGDLQEPEYHGVELAPGAVFHVSKDVKPETLEALQKTAELVMQQYSKQARP